MVLKLKLPTGKHTFGNTPFEMKQQTKKVIQYKIFVCITLYHTSLGFKTRNEVGL